MKAVCEVSPLEERLLRSPEAPIVLLQEESLKLCKSVKSHNLPIAAPRQSHTSASMLPYTPLHHLLMAELDFPVVATSGNLSDEPICTDEREALERLGGIADVFLVHNRPIVRHVDDSIVRVMLGPRTGFAPRARLCAVAGSSDAEALKPIRAPQSLSNQFWPSARI